MPALMMVIFLVKRKWEAILGFLSVWILALALVSILNSAAIPRYFEENKTTTFAIMERTDNLSPLLTGYRYGGWLGAASIVLFFSLIVFVNRRYFYEWKTFPSTRIWMLLAYLAVACLPIFWIYSLTPLLPVLVFLIFQRKIVTTIICLYCILIPSIYLHGDELSLVLVTSAALLTGLAFILDVLPIKIFQKQWRLGLPDVAETKLDSKA
jgi:hypothetical protein